MSEDMFSHFLTETVCLFVLGLNDRSTLLDHFVSSPREREERDSRDSRRDEREGQGKRENDVSEETRNKNSSTLPLPAARIADLAQQ